MTTFTVEQADKGSTPEGREDQLAKKSDMNKIR